MQVELGNTAIYIKQALKLTKSHKIKITFGECVSWPVNGAYHLLVELKSLANLNTQTIGINSLYSAGVSSTQLCFWLITAVSINTHLVRLWKDADSEKAVEKCQIQEGRFELEPDTRMMSYELTSSPAHRADFGQINKRSALGYSFKTKTNRKTFRNSNHVTQYKAKIQKSQKCTHTNKCTEKIMKSVKGYGNITNNCGIILLSRTTTFIIVSEILISVNA